MDEGSKQQENGGHGSTLRHGAGRGRPTEEGLRNNSDAELSGLRATDSGVPHGRSFESTRRCSTVQVRKGLRGCVLLLPVAAEESLHPYPRQYAIAVQHLPQGVPIPAANEISSEGSSRKDSRLYELSADFRFTGESQKAHRNCQPHEAVCVYEMQQLF